MYNTNLQSIQLINNYNLYKMTNYNCNKNYNNWITSTSRHRHLMKICLTKYPIYTLSNKIISKLFNSTNKPSNNNNLNWTMSMSNSSNIDKNSVSYKLSITNCYKPNIIYSNYNKNSPNLTPYKYQCNKRTL